MVGDGLNDAPALAIADIGISMGVSGSVLANETGHVILMANDIRKIPVAVRLARKVFEDHPLVWAAVLADVGTCVVVTLNNMLLLQGTTSRSMKILSHVEKKHGACCGHEDMVQELKHLVQETEEDSCCAQGDTHDGDPNNSCCIAGDHAQNAVANLEFKTT